MQIDLDEFGLDPDQCCYCMNASILKDKYGLPWCEEHQHRGKLLNWGWQHGWPDLHCFPYAIGRGEYCWYIAITAGLDELIWMALAAIEHSAASEQLLSCFSRSHERESVTTIKGTGDYRVYGDDEE